jgi:hypothetical protein
MGAAKIFELPASARDRVVADRGASGPVYDAQHAVTDFGGAPSALPQTSRVESAVAAASRYCQDDRYASAWVEFLAGEVWTIRRFIAGPDYPGRAPTIDSINALLAEFIRLSEALRRCCLVSASYGTAEANRSVIRALRVLGHRPADTGGYAYWCGLRGFCASLCFYWALAGTLVRKDFTTLGAFMNAPIRTGVGECAAAAALPLLSLGDIDWKVLRGFEPHQTPVSDFVFRLFASEVADAGVHQGAAEHLFDDLELLISLQFSHLRLKQLAASRSPLWFWTPLGRYVTRWKTDRIADRIAGYAALPENHGLLRAGLLGGTPTLAAQAVEAMLRSVRGAQPSPR